MVVCLKESAGLDVSTAVHARNCIHRKPSERGQFVYSSPAISVSAWDAAEDRGHAGAPRGCVLAESCIVSAAFLDGIQEKALAEARTAAEEAIKQRKASQTAASTSSEGVPVLTLFGIHSCHHRPLAGRQHGRHMTHAQLVVGSRMLPNPALQH